MGVCKAALESSVKYLARDLGARGMRVNAISQIKHDEVKPKIILADIGMVTETDVSLAKASNAVLIAFNVKPSKEAKKLAENEKIKISSYNIIYEVLDYIKQKMSGLLSPLVVYFLNFQL